MNAWQRLLAASSLAIGTAWDLITHPKLGGGGSIVVDSITMTSEPHAAMTVDDTPSIVVFSDEPVMTVLADTPVTLSVADQITLKVQP